MTFRTFVVGTICFIVAAVCIFGATLLLSEIGTCVGTLVAAVIDGLLIVTFSQTSVKPRRARQPPLHHYSTAAVQQPGVPKGQYLERGDWIDPATGQSYEFRRRSKKTGRVVGYSQVRYTVHEQDAHE